LAVEEIPLNLYMEREMNNIKLVFIDNYIYADHSYKPLSARAFGSSNTLKGDSSTLDLLTEIEGSST
jgi:hypothetical protein